ncbi:serine protease 53-like [Cloeon dipterum]|uniref:serine protease 53-like n=1 Tax=Cloeon dipterum TaxID=197152 RepID=UPI0032208531
MKVAPESCCVSIIFLLAASSLYFCNAQSLQHSKRSLQFEFPGNLSHRDCGLERNSDARAWLAKIEIFDETENTVTRCYGSVISNRYIITASDAGCVEGEAIASQVSVSFAKSGFRSVVKPSRLIVEPQNPLAILEFESDLLKDGVVPICVWNKPIAGNGSPVHENGGIIATIVGEEVSASRKVTAGKFKVVSNEDCGKAINHGSFYFKSNDLCLMYQEGLSRVCLKGWGAPMQFKIGARWFLRGVNTNFFNTEDKSAECRFFRIYKFTDVARKIKFITENTDIKLRELATDFYFPSNLNHEDCGRVQNNNDRAWQVKVSVDYFVCYGSVISKYHVVTAAYCVNGKDPSDVIVTFAKNRFQIQESLRPSEIVVHPEYDSERLQANLAILKFDRNLLEGGVLPICLWNKPIEANGSLITDNQGIASVAGEDGNSGKKVVGKFKVSSTADCKAEVNPQARKNFKDPDLCLIYQEGVSSVCLRGWGAPMQFKIGDRWYLRGVNNDYLSTHKEVECSVFRVLGFTDVARHIKFFAENIKITPKPSIPQNHRSYPNCGVVHSDPGIQLAFRGTDAKLRDFPWSAALFRTSTASPPEYTCTGSLISKKFILTAAHCVYEARALLPPQALIVALGKEQLNDGWTSDSGVQLHSLRKIVAHEEYNLDDHRNDIALLELNRDVEFSVIISPVCLWFKTKNVDIIQGRNGTIAGWGLVADYDTGNILQKLELPIFSIDECSSIHGKESYYARKLQQSPSFCAGYLFKNTNPCNGDSGSALVLQEENVFFVRGIVSETIARNVYGAKFCDPEFPAVFTDVAGFREWILEKAGSEISFDYSP